MLQEGRTQQAVADEFEVSRQAGQYLVEALSGRRLGQLKEAQTWPKGSSRKLTPEQENEVQKLITEKTPNQLKL
jgi:transposase